MLVGCGMEDIVGMMLGEDAFHTGGIGDAGYDGFARDISIVLFHEEADIVHWGLSLVNENQALWLVDGNLLHHLGTYTSGCSRYQNGATAEELSYRIHIHFDFVSWKKVFDIHLAHHLMTEV